MTRTVPIGTTLGVADLSGVWLRSLYLGPHGERDDQTQVTWIQAGTAFVDLRQPPGRPWFDCSRELTITATQHAWLRSQQAFAGTLVHDNGGYRWNRELDLHPPGPHPDAGMLRFDGEVLVENGHHVDYIEHWVPAGGADRPVSAARLVDPDGRPGMLLRVGEDFGWARGRQRQADFLDCEFAIGRITPAGWRIVSSTLPLRDGVLLDLHAICTDWTVQNIEGDRAPWQR
jgi:allophanate hydrolase